MRVFLKKEGFGDLNMAAMWVSILIDNNIDAYLDHKQADLFDIPNSGDANTEYLFDYSLTFRGRSIFDQNVENFRKIYNKHIYITRNRPQAKIEDSPESYDLVMMFKSSKYSAFRNWPYKVELKKILESNSISYLDIDDQIHGPKTLGIIRNSKSFVTIDSGLAHYASGFSYKGLILNSGYSYIDYWSIYNYNFLNEPVNCMNCFLSGKSLKKCPAEYVCMTRISPEIVMDTIQKIIKRN